MVVALLASSAYADDVNLLTSTPTTVAVSSTVANANILPEHLVDGKLSTAWNSRTGELVGSWIAVRVPPDAKVKTIKLTAGFTQKDKRLGDLFTQNPRIKRVRISQGGNVIAEKALDTANRGLQEIPVDIPGGDFEIRVLEVELGTKKAWRETCVSELQVWGTVPKIVKSKPSVRIRSLDAPPTLTREQCIKAVFPDARNGRIGPDKTDEQITAVEDHPISDGVVVCRIDHKVKTEPETTTEIAAVQRAKLAVIAKVTESTKTEERKSMGDGDAGSVQLEVVTLTNTEKALLVKKTQSAYGPMMDVGESESVLYRVTAKDLVSLVTFKSTWSNGEATGGDYCELAPFTVGKSMPTLVLDCVTLRGHWHDENPDDRGEDRTEHKVRYRWKDGAYVEK